MQAKLLQAYDTALQWVLLRQTGTLVIGLLSLIITLWLCTIIPKGFFPVEDTGVIQGITEAPASISFSAMQERQKIIAKISGSASNILFKAA